jgi:hypothetical protein
MRYYILLFATLVISGCGGVSESSWHENIIRASALAGESTETFKNGKRNQVTDSHISATYIDSSASMIFTGIGGVRRYTSEPWDSSSIHNLQIGENFYIWMSRDLTYRFHVYKRNGGEMEVGILAERAPEPVVLPAEEAPVAQPLEYIPPSTPTNGLGPDGYVGNISIFLNGGADLIHSELGSSSGNDTRLSFGTELLYTAAPNVSYGIHINHQSVNYPMNPGMNFSMSVWSASFQIRLYSKDRSQ